MNGSRKVLAALVVVPLLAAAVGCSDKPKPTTPTPPPAAAPAAAPAPTAAATPAPSASAARADFHEEDFSESDRSRDPFRNFGAILDAKRNLTAKHQRAVILDKYSVEELKLVALVTKTDEPRAMLVDPTGKGWVVTRGQYVGRSEIVRASGQSGAEYELNWRVDRITDLDGVLLVREDPAHSDVPVATKVIVLPKDQRNSEGLETSPN
jgi:type IV pilus assembly protein PilP